MCIKDSSRIHVGNSGSSTTSSSSSSSGSNNNRFGNNFGGYRSVSTSRGGGEYNSTNNNIKNNKIEIWVDGPALKAASKPSRCRNHQHHHHHYRPVVNLENEIWIDGPKAVGFRPSGFESALSKGKFQFKNVYNNLRLGP